MVDDNREENIIRDLTHDFFFVFDTSYDKYFKINVVSFVIALFE